MFSAALTLFGVAFFCWLGSWQLSRAEQKRALLAQYQAGQRTQITLTSENADTLARYQRVRITGRYDPEHQILLDNMPSHAGRPGFRVLTPMQSPAGWLLVDRGWLPLGATRAELPNVSVLPGDRTITGTMDSLPRAGITLESAPVAAETPWPRVLSFPTQADLEQQLGHKLIPGVLLLDPSQPDGYERIWEAHLGFKPERHIGYAVQWFALAAVAVVIFVLMGFRTKKATDERPH
jgi:surfeit locus 1 family protein